MTTKRKTIEGSRALLNLPGHHSTAAIVAEIVSTGDGQWDTHATVVISDCSRVITLEFNPCDPDEHENDLHKLDTLLAALKDFRRGLVKTQKKYA